MLKPTQSPFLIVHNGTPGRISKLRFGDGFAVGDTTCLRIGWFGRADASASCTLLVTEFDQAQTRSGSTRIALNSAHDFTPKPGTSRILIALQFEGVGNCIVHGVSVVSSGKPAQDAPRPEVDPATLPPQWPDKEQIFVRYSDALKLIQTEASKAHKFSSEAYKWRRRALEWEKRAQLTKNGGSLDSLTHAVLVELAASLPTSNGSRFYKKLPCTVGIVTDIYMYNFYKDAFETVHYLSPDNYRTIMSETPLDAFIYVSCWSGIENDEWRGVKFREKPQRALAEIIRLARKSGAKLIFQSIEDPSNFDYFLPIAEQFDYVFTSDSDCIGKYKQALGHDRVYYGEYGINPLIHNPIGSRRHLLNRAFFAGSWASRYEERCKDMEVIFDSVRAAGDHLVVVDRNYGTELADHQYPDRFRDALLPAVDHTLLQSMHKLFRYNINLNSIKGSPTMCAMRAYELQAMGVGILSNYAKSIFNNFPEVRIIPWRQDMTPDFRLPQDQSEYRRNMALVRNVLNGRTAFDTAWRLLKRTGMDLPAPEPPVVCVLRDDDQADIHENIQRQSYPHIVVAGVDDFKDEASWNEFVQRYNISYFTWFSASDYYERNYIQDLLNAFKYTDCRYITKSAWFDGDRFHDGVQHDYTDAVGGRARTLFSSKDFVPQEFFAFGPHQQVTNIAGGYAIDPFELNYLRTVRKHAQPKAPRLSVIVPIYNNGRFLRAKCIESLRRNGLWPEIEVLLIDDGSGDPETLRVIDDLEGEHPNVRAFHFCDGGSGSASRPRNKGIELAQAHLISFLDPDNEISPRGYDALLAILEEADGKLKGGVDFVSGFHVKVEQVAREIGKRSSQRAEIIDDLKSRYLLSGRFPTVPTQPAILKKRLFQSGELRFVENSAGQDTLFGWQLLCHAKAGVFTDAAYLVYYAQRSDSIVNVVDPGYFQKKLVLERAQHRFLSSHGILDAYVQKRYHDFMNNWYLPRLRQIPDQSHRVACATIIAQIADLYGQPHPPEVVDLLSSGVATTAAGGQHTVA